MYGREGESDRMVNIDSHGHLTYTYMYMEEEEGIDYWDITFVLEGKQ